LIGNTPEGQVVHYLLGPFGKNSHGPLWNKAELPPQVNHLIFSTEYPDLASRGWFANSEKVLFLNHWADVLRVLQPAHGEGTRVVVYPNADIQYCR
ncbi:MAG: hypothetical protein PHU08_03060, partial [Dehalococcoidales bacterium]|nr:hypothetical protein [Dehalococcoidales bacterium]